MQNLFGMTLPGLRSIVRDLDLPPFAAGQLARWLYRKGAPPIEAMTDLPQAARMRLNEAFRVEAIAPASVRTAEDGTKKYLFPIPEERSVEAAYIPDGSRATLCLSSQAGCRMGCAFCMTGRQGLSGQLGPDAILAQIVRLPERDRLTNLVYMGMGEPLDNLPAVLDSLEILTAPWGFGWSPTRITLSTAGVLPAMPALIERSRVHLAVSLHNPFPEERARLMPVERAWPIREVVGLLRRHDFSAQRRLSFEYIVLEGINDSPRHVKELARLLGGLSCRINLIRFHRIPSSPFYSPDERGMEAFRDALLRKGLRTTIRRSRGEEIGAACGLLSTLNAG